jgi:hypothetical protein
MANKSAVVFAISSLSTGIKAVQYQNYFFPGIPQTVIAVQLNKRIKKVG